jgi:septum formation inhibitor MinC
LIEDGQNPQEIEQLLDEKFNQLDQYIKNVDFFVDIEKVVKTVQPETDKVLKGL